MTAAVARDVSAASGIGVVIGVVPAGAQLPEPDPGGPLERLRLVESGELAAVVGTPPGDRPWGRAEDLLAHDRLLARLVTAGTPVLPVRFGTVLDDDAEVVSELLDPSRDTLLAELDQVTGTVQYTVKVRYEQDAVLAELVDSDPEIRRLREAARTQDSFDVKLRLGQLVVEALERRRPAVADALLRELGEHPTRLHEPSSPDDVLTVAMLVDRTEAAAFERRLERVAKRYAGRLRVRLVGPTAAYDFVGGR